MDGREGSEAKINRLSMTVTVSSIDASDWLRIESRRGTRGKSAADNITFFTERSGSLRWKPGSPEEELSRGSRILI